MRFTLAVHGTRGDVEPCAAVGRELLRRGHDVRMAAPPNLIDFVESSGIPGVVAYGPDSQKQLEADFFREFWKVQNPVTLIRKGMEYITEGWAEMSATLVELTEGADLVLTGTTYQEVVANVAEYRGIPLAALHYFPARVNSSAVPIPAPPPLIRSVWASIEWLHWRMMKDAEDEQRRELGLTAATVRCARRIVESGALEIQAYDRIFFPGLSEEWDGTRPFVGALTMELRTSTDDDVASWIALGKPPIYFGFGSMPVESPAEAVAMISAVCAKLGERALISSGVWDLDDTAYGDHVKLVGAVNHAAVFPACRAVVHHGGAGTTAAGMRAGVPTLVLWVGADQPVWANQVKRLEVGIARRFTSTNQDRLLADLRRVLEPRFAARASEVAARLTKPGASIETTADLLEEKAGVMAAK
ncbi:glycosyltransferase [Mycolicibacterium sp. P9-64]|uniref:glycosyltransferase n=1 Tax=Mycolicibacterium sp. P9-64 TaxID=2024612 RepID=UPI0011EC420A|nr:glycosyltransferase [Mycolicibacterium sp. P9-64]KAA0084727.1 glycosyltransferase [Mycolicibacterium sp. P9-64]